MCKPKKKTATSQAIQPQKSTTSRSSRGSSAAAADGSSSTNKNTGSGAYFDYSWQSSSIILSPASMPSLRETLPENPHIYDFSEICSATGNLSAKKFSSSSSSASWRCVLRGNDVLVFQRKLLCPISTDHLRERLSLICKGHHASLIKLRGASVSGNYIYLVYDYVHGANLADCLRNPRNPNFTVLSNWMSRMQIASDLAHGLDYIHHSTGLSSRFVHNHIESSSIIVTEEPPTSLNARICHFGTAELCGEIAINDEKAKVLKRSDSRKMKLEGTRGYMSPEFQSTGIATQKTDVYAFGVVILELLSGEEPIKYRFEDENGGDYKRISVLETAREAVAEGGGGMLRRWIDKRLKDSYPVAVAEEMTRVGLDCVESDPNRRPDMGSVAGRISKLYLDSENWAQTIGVPADFSFSLGPR